MDKHNIASPTPDRIIGMASAFYDSCVLFTASDIGIFTCLAKMPGSSSDQVAVELKTDPRATRLILDACAALNFVTKHGETYSNSPETALYLIPGQPGDLSKAIRYNRDVYPAWGKLIEFARSGKPVEKPEIHLGDDPARTRAFVLSMHGRAMGIGRSVLPLLELKGCHKLFDAGGGPGAYSTLIAQANPGLTCTVMDLPGVVAVARELISAAGMDERVKTLAGDYHTTPFPSGNDAVIFFGVLHQESPADIVALFRKAFTAMNPGGRIYVLDMMTDLTRTSPAFSALFAVNMALTTNNGWVFSDHDCKDWLTQAGFTDFTCQPLPPSMPHWLVSARKPL